MSRPVVRKTKIVCTLGPGCDDEEKLKGIIKAGMNAARFNFSHGSHEETKVRLDRFQKCCKEIGAYIPMILDTKGPEIRTGKFKDKIKLNMGQKFTFTINECEGTQERCSVSHKGFAKDLKPGNIVLVDDGLIEMKVDKVTETDVECTVLNSGKISSNKGVNLPSVEVSLPSLTEKDIGDLKFGCENGFDFVAASFIRSKEDVMEIKKYLKEFGKPEIKIISKIENQSGLDNFDAILEVSDGVMVARGDLGVEIPVERLPLTQKEMIQKTVKANKICITATQMLDSMINNPRPTRAEVTDVANAILDGTTAIMLSGETANGSYPVEAVTMMNKIALEVESKQHPLNLSKSIEDMQKLDFNKKDERRVLVNFNIAFTANLMKGNILSLTEQGLSARILSILRPNCQLLCITTQPQVAKDLSLMWGTYTIVINEPDFDKRMLLGIEEFKKLGYLQEGDICVISGGTMSLDSKGKKNIGTVYKV